MVVSGAIASTPTTQSGAIASHNAGGVQHTPTNQWPPNWRRSTQGRWYWIRDTELWEFKRYAIGVNVGLSVWEVSTIVTINGVAKKKILFEALLPDGKNPPNY